MSTASPAPPTSYALPLLLHTLLELPASYNFLQHPSATLRAPQPHAHALIQQYAVLLLVLNLVLWLGLHYRHTLATALRPFPGPARRLRIGLALSLALYHAGAMVRAVGRVKERAGPPGGDGWGSAAEGEAPGGGGGLVNSPVLHFLLHAGVLGALLGEAGWDVLGGMKELVEERKAKLRAMQAEIKDEQRAEVEPAAEPGEEDGRKAKAKGRKRK